MENKEYNLGVLQDLKSALCLILVNDPMKEEIEQALDMAITALKQMPKKGQWIMRPNDLFPEEGEQECSVCHALQPISIVDDDYCPNCGAKMESEE